MYFPIMFASASRFSRDRWMLALTLKWLITPRLTRIMAMFRMRRKMIRFFIGYRGPGKKSRDGSPIANV
jgi:hypothetical protein